MNKQDVIAHFLQYAGSESAMVHSQISLAFKSKTDIPEQSAAMRVLNLFHRDFPEEFRVLCDCTVEDWKSPA